MSRPRFRPLVLASLVAAMAAASAARAEDFTVATYNVGNFFDVFDDPYTKDEETGVKPRHEMRLIARVIRALDADAIALQEIESEALLEAFAERMLPDAGYRHAYVAPTDDKRGISVGLLSRVPIRRAVSYRLRSFPIPEGGERHFARPFVRLDLAIETARGQRTLMVYLAHFKSQRDGANDPNSNRWRLGEARAARRIVRRRMSPGAWVLLAGDLNAAPDSPAVRALTAEGPLHDLHRRLPSSERITYRIEPHRGTLDYLLASRALARRLERDSARVVAREELLGGSDHAPVVATFALPD